jgi:rRNA maturation RNase YbeY
MAITYHTEDYKIPPIKRRILNKWIHTVAGIYGKKVGEIAYIFCSEEKILEINRQYLQHDYYTDIITFDYSEADIIAGDVFISPETARSNAAKFNTFYPEELHRTLIHGILHLCGIDDKGEGEREIMEKNENQALTILSKEAYKDIQ